MNENAYELVALAMRYFFAAMMVLIVLRAGRGALVDSRRAAKLRRLSPSTGITGELIVTEGDGKIRRGTRYPVIQEGIIGSSRKADISVRHPAVRRRHAYFQLTKEGLRIRGHAGAKLYVAKHTPVREFRLGDGGAFAIGPIRFLLVLGDGRSWEDAMFEPHSPAVHSRDAEPPREDDPDAPFRRPQEDVSSSEAEEDSDTRYRDDDSHYDSDSRRNHSRYDSDSRCDDTDGDSDSRYDDSRYDDTDGDSDSRYGDDDEPDGDSRFDDSSYDDDDDDDFFTVRDDRNAHGDSEDFPRVYRPARQPVTRRRRPER